MAFNNFTERDADNLEDFFPNLPSLNINSIPSSQSRVAGSISPEEMVIRSRGRRHYPPSFSPERIETSSPVYSRHFSPQSRQTTPPRPPKPIKNTHSSISIVAPEQARKQLEFQEGEGREFSILKLLPVIKKTTMEQDMSSLHPSEIEFLSSNNGNNAKKQRISAPDTGSLQPNPLQLAKGLSKKQLVDLLGSLVASNPYISSYLEKSLPKPDLSGLASNLTYLSQNIYKAIPVTRLSDRADSLAFSRVSTHLSAFKKSLVEDLSMLMESGQWGSVLEYVVLSWDIVRATPVWTNPSHNTMRNSCFKHLAISVIKVMKQQDFNFDIITRRKLLEIMAESPIREVQLCKEMLNKSDL